MQRLQPADARMHWMSARIPNDQFMLYAFASADQQPDVISEYLRARARCVPDLNVRVMEVPGSLDRPYWIAARARDAQCVNHRGPWTWQSMLDQLARVMAAPLDATRAPWRLHVFDAVTAPPEHPAEGDLTVVVLQIVHALGDGRVTANIARELFSGDRQTPVGPPRRRGASALATSAVTLGASALGAARLPVEMAQMLGRGVLAYRRAQGDRTSAGRATTAGVPYAASGTRPSRLNRPPGSERELRTITVAVGELRRGEESVTSCVLEAISVALPRYLGEPHREYAVELPVGRQDWTHPDSLRRRDKCRQRNNFRSVSIDLPTAIVDRQHRAAAIGEQIRAARSRDTDPALIAARRAEDCTPAVLTQWGIRNANLTRPPETVMGNTVVSSVDRGGADFGLLGGAVVFSAGFPSLSPAQGLTHGVHGLGDTVTISLTTSPRVCPDIDRYHRLLTQALHAW